ncbi:MAG: AmmeMemoRadiSam system radical SAM enzyme [Clostridiales Family XIII bacterium]|nr:AmmeMemoRadiSam system radical SAM enzyme [Clostridia bacterium]MDY3010800.1 AmmeMemoRadiSam system radical SAM enzyme [Clostridiales Family XIII bacterium]
MKRQCQVCMHHCLLAPGQKGRCGARKNENGRSLCETYGKITALALDPIEKKPLRRFYPGSLILSVGSYGCNLDCPFCQNYQIARPESGSWEHRSICLSPQELMQKGIELKVAGNIGLAFTYNEPLVGFEYVRDTAKAAQEEGLKTVCVTNGSVCKEIAQEVLPHIDALNIDLKGFTETYYRKLGGDLETVKAFIKQAAASCHVELTTLIVPGENDSPQEIKKLASWVASVDAEIPLHVTRFYPMRKMRDRAATEIETVYQLAEVARTELKDVFTGNC